MHLLYFQRHAGRRDCINEHYRLWVWVVLVRERKREREKTVSGFTIITTWWVTLDEQQSEIFQASLLTKTRKFLQSKKAVQTIPEDVRPGRISWKRPAWISALKTTGNMNPFCRIWNQDNHVTWTGSPLLWCGFPQSFQLLLLLLPQERLHLLMRQ